MHCPFCYYEGYDWFCLEWLLQNALLMSQKSTPASIRKTCMKIVKDLNLQERYYQLQMKNLKWVLGEDFLKNMQLRITNSATSLGASNPESATMTDQEATNAKRKQEFKRRRLKSRMS